MTALGKTITFGKVSGASLATKITMPGWLLSRQSNSTLVAKFGGNKGKSLRELADTETPVPAWNILGSPLFEAFKTANKIKPKIERELSQLQALSEAQFFTEVKERAERIQKLIVDAELSAELIDLISSAFSTLVSDAGQSFPLAIRSSGAEEDGDDHSFAGQFDSYLNVIGLDAVLERVKHCWASLYSERALTYRKRKRLTLHDTTMGVILQRMIAAEKSGVAFTANPANGSPYEMVVSSVFGLGDGLVSGAVDADTVTFVKRTGRIVQTVIGKKSLCYQKDGVVEVSRSRAANLSLSEREIADIRGCAMAIETRFGKPQDIEWSIADGQLWILQARPITCATIWPEGEVRIWDNSNIVENYPGLSSHLTFSLTQQLYANVFREYCRQLLIPPRQLQSMDEVFNNLLGHLNGQIYYNLLNWYRMVGVNPMQKTGRKMLEVQMGVNVPLDLDQFSDKIEPYRCRSSLERRLIRLLSGARFGWFFITLDHMVKGFKRDFYKQFRRYDSIDYHGLNADQIYQHYKQFELEVIRLWGTTLAIESSIGLPFGILKALTQRWIPEAPPWFEAALLGNVGVVESMEPVAELNRIAKWVSAHGRYSKLVRETPAKVLYDRLSALDAHDLLREIDEYIRRFGYRSQNELKLEEPDLRQKPRLLMEMLKSAVAASDDPGNVAKPATSHESARITEKRVEEIVRDRLRPWQRFIYRQVRDKVRTAIACREAVRFCRSRVFGIFRNMFLAIGEDLKRAGVLESTRDIFFLKLEDLNSAFDGKISQKELNAIIGLRTKQFESHRVHPPLPARFMTRGPTAVWLNSFAQTLEVPKAGHDGFLRGISCCAGEVTDTATVVSEPNEFKRGILVTYRTDPGWVVVFPLASGILIERGSPLAHASIVARELEIPTLVQIPNLTATVKSGMTLQIDGNTGVVRVLYESKELVKPPSKQAADIVPAD